MSGEFTLENDEGDILFASTPGMKVSETSVKKSSVKKYVDKKLNKREDIEIFNTLAGKEKEQKWIDRFQKMASNKILEKIRFIRADTSDDFYGELMYKNRQVISKLKIYKNQSIEEISEAVKKFIKSHTNIDTIYDNEDDIKILDKTSIKPITWNKLSPKDHSNLLVEYIEEFANEKNINKKDKDNLRKNVILYAMGKNILPFLTLSESGKIENISNIYKDDDGNYLIK